MPKKIISKSVLWQVNHFKKVVDYLDLSRNLLAMICVDKEDVKLENYKHYGFLIDIVDHLLVLGEKFLKEKKSILEPLGGKEKLSELLETLKRLRDRDTHAGDLDSQLGHWENLTSEQLTETIERAAEKEDKEEAEEEEKKNKKNKKKSKKESE
ncbi:MAG: hypothetical protein ACTSXV_01420 [Alphaproteobacteria bacterium]